MMKIFMLDQKCGQGVFNDRRDSNVLLFDERTEQFRREISFRVQKINGAGKGWYPSRVNIYVHRFKTAHTFFSENKIFRPFFEILLFKLGVYILNGYDSFGYFSCIKELTHSNHWRS